MKQYTLSALIVSLILSGALYRAADAEGTDKPARPRPENSVSVEYTALGTDGFDQSRYSLKSTIKLFSLGSMKISAWFGGEYIATESAGYFPDELCDLNLGLGARDENNIFEVFINSRSDRPFHSMDETAAGMYVFHRVWPRPHGGLYAGLIYFPFEQIVPKKVVPVNVPFPFLMYLHATQELFVMAGIPTIVRWNPTEFLFLDFQYLPSRNITAWTGVRAGRAFRAGPEFAWRQHNYLIAGREDKDEKLYQDHKQAGLKVSYRLFYVVEISLFGGYLFDARCFTGEKYDDVNNERKVRDGLILSAEAKAVF